MPITDAPLGLYYSVIAFLVVVLIGLHVATGDNRARALGSGIGGMGVWILASAMVPLLLNATKARPEAQFFVFLPFLAITIYLAFSSYGLRIAQAPMWVLIGIHVFRVPLEYVLDIWHGAGFVPVQMTYHGANFDIVTGVLAGLLGLALIYRRDMVPNWVLVAFSLLGLVMLANILRIVNLSSPTAMRDLVGGYLTGPDMLPAFSFPAVWIATMAVMPATFLHIAVLRRLRGERRQLDAATV